jgi:hypothetical protein
MSVRPDWQATWTTPLISSFILPLREDDDMAPFEVPPRHALLGCRTVAARLNWDAGSPESVNQPSGLFSVLVAYRLHEERSVSGSGTDTQAQVRKRFFPVSPTGCDL